MYKYPPNNSALKTRNMLFTSIYTNHPHLSLHSRAGHFNLNYDLGFQQS